jgi:hypothetical protein
MKKIPSIFLRDFTLPGNPLTREKNPECQWVFDGEGVATIKFDGTACMIRDGLIYKRYDAKNGKTPPEGFIPCQEPDLKTGHWPGWLLCDNKKSEDKYFIKGLLNRYDLTDGTYELCGPKINGNPEKLESHRLIKHGILPQYDFPTDYDEIFLRFSMIPIMEGIVWHDFINERMAKIKLSDFGLKRINNV